MQMNFKSADLEKVWPKLEPLCCVSLTHSNPKGGAHVTQDSIANQNLHMELPVRRGSDFRVPSLQVSLCNSADLSVSVESVLIIFAGCCEVSSGKLRTSDMVSTKSSPIKKGGGGQAS